MSRPGFLSPSELTTVQGSLQLANKAAWSFLAMRDAAAEQDHVNIEIVPPGGAYRTMTLTLAMRANPRTYNVTPGILPSLTSPHLEGDAADYGQGLWWVKKNGHKYGWSFPLKSDENHGVFDGTTLAGGGTLINEIEETMYGIKITVISKPDPLNGKVPVGSYFIGAGTDPIVWVSNPGPEQLAGVQFAEWDSKSVAERISQVGLRGSGKDLNKVYYNFADLVAYEMGGSSGGGVSPAQVSAEADRVIAAIPTTFKAE